MPGRRTKSLIDETPGSIEELKQLRGILIDRLSEAGAPYVSSITAKLLDIGARISELTAAESRRVEQSARVPDEPFDPSTI